MSVASVDFDRAHFLTIVPDHLNSMIMHKTRLSTSVTKDELLLHVASMSRVVKTNSIINTGILS